MEITTQEELIELYGGDCVNLVRGFYDSRPVYQTSEANDSNGALRDFGNLGANEISY